MIDLCISEYIKNIRRNVLIWLLLSAVNIMVLLTIGNIRTSYKYYNAIKDYIGNKGICVIDTDGIIKADISKELDNIQEIKSYKIFEISTLYYDKGDNVYKKLYLYNKEDEKVMPALKSGKWYESDANDKSIINVLVSENEYGIHTGDVIESHYLTEKGDVKSVNIKVVGTFNDGERIAGIVQYSPSENMSYNSFYSTFDAKQNEDIIFVTTEKEFSKFSNAIRYSAYGGALIKCKDNISDERIKEIKEEIRNYRIKVTGNTQLLSDTIDMKIIKNNSEVQMRKSTMEFMPFAIVMIMISVICIISISAISTLEGLRNYTIYYITGMKWNGIIKINSFSIVCSIGMSVVLSTVEYWIMKIKFANIANRIDISVAEIMIIAGIWLCFIFLAIIMPLSILHRNKPAELIKQER
jgi:hypothetical protein